VRRGAAPLRRGRAAPSCRPLARLALLALALSGTRAAAAQEQPSSFVLTFSNPGARSLAFGGAFAPLADDATAAYANPAGLVQLLRPEFSAEGRLHAEIGDTSTEEVQLSNASGLSFFSAVYPLRRFSFAAYLHNLAQIEVENDLSPQRPARALGPATAGERLIGLDIWRLGLAAAYRLRDNLSLGAGVSYFRGTTELVPADDPSAPSRSEKSTDWALNAGVLWSPTEQVRLGGFYREGPALSLGTSGASSCPGQEGTSPSLRLPDSYGAGAALRSAGGALTVAFEWDRVLYSSLADGLSAAACGAGALSLGDVDELHVGAEYAFLRLDPVLALRVGAWLDPEHRLCGTGADSPYLCPAGQGEDEVHGTLGLGMAFRHFQIDFGLDGSRSQVTLSLSGIVSF
jgi:hypothetical protein